MNEKTKKTLMIISGAAFAILVVLILLFAPREESGQMSSRTNQLLKENFRTGDVKSGSGNIIGEYGYIKTSTRKLENATSAEIREFAETYKDKGYNWVSIICYDNTGICFIGANPDLPEYGELNRDGSVKKTLKIIEYKDGEYIYKNVV